MRVPRLSANGWLLLVLGLVLAGLAGEPAYRAITGKKSAAEVRLEKAAEAAMKQAQGPLVGQDAPAFTLKSVPDGHTVSLSDFRGRRVLMTFFCGCYLCREVAGEWEKLQKAHLKNPPVVVGICYFAPDRLQPFIKDTGAKDLIYLHDVDKKIGTLYGSKVCPRTWLIDEHGKVAYRHEEIESSMPHSPVPIRVRELLARPQLQMTAAR